MAMVEAGVQDKILPEWESFRKRSKKAGDLTDAQRMALTAPIFARAALVTALHEAGIVTPEANFQHGAGALHALMQRLGQDAPRKS